jgi:hypothetical protein
LSAFESSEERGCLAIGKKLALVNEGNPLVGKSTNLVDIPIPANRAIVIRADLTPAGVFGQYGCAVDTMLAAEPDRSYLLKLRWEKNDCMANLFLIDDGQETSLQVEQTKPRC